MSEQMKAAILVARVTERAEQISEHKAEKEAARRLKEKAVALVVKLNQGMPEDEALMMVEQAEGNDDRFIFLDEDDIRNLPDPVWMFPDYMPDAAACGDYGAPGSGKSFLGLEEAMSICSGKPLFGDERLTPARTGAVVIYGGEGFIDMVKRRWPVLRAKYGIPPGQKLPVYFVKGTPAAVADDEFDRITAAIDRVLGDRPLGFILIDNHSLVMHLLDEDKAAQAGRATFIYNGLVARYLRPVKTIFHTGKDDARGIRGSNAALGNLDFVRFISGVTNPDKSLSITIRQDGNRGKNRLGADISIRDLMGVDFTDPVSGKTSLVLRAMTKEETTKVRQKEEGVAFRRQVLAAEWEAGLVSQQAGLTIGHMADLMAGPPPDGTGVADLAWKTRRGEIYNKLDLGSRWTKPPKDATKLLPLHGCFQRVDLSPAGDPKPKMDRVFFRSPIQEGWERAAEEEASRFADLTVSQEEEW